LHYRQKVADVGIGFVPVIAGKLPAGTILQQSQLIKVIQIPQQESRIDGLIGGNIVTARS